MLQAVDIITILTYSAGEQTTEVTANFKTSTESDIADTSQVTSAIALTELTGTDISIVFKMTYAAVNGQLEPPLLKDLDVES